jgi:hypothetical protein
MRLAAALLAMSLLLPLAQAHGAGDDHEVDADPAAAFFPTADEVKSAIDAVRGHPWFTLRVVGNSTEGRPLTVLEVTDPASTVPRAQRVVTLLETQQHGNEPAGTGAAVPLIADLAADGSPLRGLLSNQVLLLLPMSNPDGATANTRANRGGADINRDHVGLETPEAQAIKRILREWDVHVAIDHHEYSGTGAGAPVPVRVYDWDLTTMTPNHGNVRAPTAQAAADLNAAVWESARAAGYSVGEYGWTTVNGLKVEQGAGGPDPGILRNAFGLSNVAGLLGETFISAQPEGVDGATNPFQSAQRRIAIHRDVMEATLRFAHDNAGALIAAKRESERLNVEEPLAEYWEPAIGQGADVESPTAATAPEVRAPLAPAYKVTEDLSDLFTLHGLPLGSPVGGGFVHNIHGEKQAGMVAAIVHPQSSRGIAEGEPAEAIPLVTPDAADDPSEEAPLSGLVVLAALGVALLAGRRP